MACCVGRVLHVMSAGGSRLSPIRLERVASAFELSRAEVLTDAETILDWSDGPGALEALLNSRHAWQTDEAYYFVRWVRLQAWCTQNRLPDQRWSPFAER